MRLLKAHGLSLSPHRKEKKKKAHTALIKSPDYIKPSAYNLVLCTSMRLQAGRAFLPMRSITEHTKKKAKRKQEYAEL